MPFMEKTFYHNTFETWFIAIGVAAIVFGLLTILKVIGHKKTKHLAERTKTSIDDLVADLLDRLKYFFLLITAIYLGARFLTLPPSVRQIIDKLLVLGFMVQSAFWGSGLFDFFISRYKQKKREEGDTASLTTFTALGFLVRLFLWSLVILLALDNLGIQVTALVAGLGIGGIAVALAVQNILGDLFASMSIVLDKPFVIGDFIVVDNLMGTVEHIGLKTTRLRSLSGEQIILANSDLLKSRIKNYKRMEERRVIFSLGVVYQTPPEKLAAIPGLVKEIIESQELARFDRCHFKEFGDFALIFETAYFIKKPDYETYMETQQAINLAIFRRFQDEGIEFAYPTQMIFLDRGSGETPSLSSRNSSARNVGNQKEKQNSSE